MKCYCGTLSHTPNCERCFQSHPVSYFCSSPQQSGVYALSGEGPGEERGAADGHCVKSWRASSPCLRGQILFFCPSHLSFAKLQQLWQWLSLTLVVEGLLASFSGPHCDDLIVELFFLCQKQSTCPAQRYLRSLSWGCLMAP